MKTITEPSDVITGVIKGVMADEVVSLREFFTGLHNAFVHGEICDYVSEEDLKDMFLHFDSLIKLSKKYE